MNRREFSQRFGLSLAVSVVQGATPDGTPTLYYVDGYHGGVRGHMPAGAWRDILNELRKLPDWKLSFDIEPASWEVLRRDDPEAFQEIRQLFSDTSVTARLEMDNGTFSQPFGWAIGHFFAWAMVQGFDSELYRVPLVVERSVYSWASLIVFGSALVSGLIVRRRIDRLDLIEVLKTRE